MLPIVPKKQQSMRLNFHSFDVLLDERAVFVSLDCPTPPVSGRTLVFRDIGAVLLLLEFLPSLIPEPTAVAAIDCTWPPSEEKSGFVLSRCFPGFVIKRLTPRIPQAGVYVGIMTFGETSLLIQLRISKKRADHHQLIAKRICNVISIISRESIV
jgi:hypothetical protein